MRSDPMLSTKTSVVKCLCETMCVDVDVKRGNREEQTSGSSVVSICREGVCTKVGHGDGANKDENSVEGKRCDGCVSLFHRIDADA